MPCRKTSPRNASNRHGDTRFSKKISYFTNFLCYEPRLDDCFLFSLFYLSHINPIIQYDNCESGLPVVECDVNTTIIDLDKTIDDCAPSADTTGSW